jgi:hypothetical protein
MPDAEFFACLTGEIDDQLLEWGPANRFASVDAKNVHSVELATLGEILGVGSYDDLITKTLKGSDAKSGESGVLEVPIEIRNALAAATGPALEQAAERWAETEEMVANMYTTEDAREVLEEIAELARTAQSQDRELWIWWSL